ncbi:hypothetical protein PR048_027429 [Dryococelus australis]|uniref:Uncharacterized protein n=1 Tax=Dryococelus australis TaxID=614101 RepID=A0ABQ9GFF5_9NEOP|nr:hypothetical protein PR048_027429 [Dryococelus australis]
MLFDRIKVVDCNQLSYDLFVGYDERRFKITHPRYKKKNAYRNYLDSSHCVPEEQNVLINCTKLIPYSSAESKRGLSFINIIVSPTRNRLLYHAYLY